MGFHAAGDTTANTAVDSVVMIPVPWMQSNLTRCTKFPAGPDHHNDPLILTPGLVPAVYGKEEYDWNFSSVPQANLNGPKINQARGKMLGGSSGLNFMMLLYPSRGIIDAWASLGNDGWNFKSLALYFKNLVSTSKDGRVASLWMVHQDPGASPDAERLKEFQEIAKQRLEKAFRKWQRNKALFN